MFALLFTTDLACSSQVTPVGARSGIPIQVAMSSARLLELASETHPRLVILDLNSPMLDCSAVVPKLKQLPGPPRIIAFGPHVHEARLTAAREAGCDRVLARGQFYAQLEDLLVEH